MEVAMSTSPATPRIHHQAPHPGILAVVFTCLSAAAVLPLTGLVGAPAIPLPWEPASAVAAFFQARPPVVGFSAFFDFGSAVVLGIFTATVVNQLRFLGVRAAGVNIALFGGITCAANIASAAFLLWTLAHPAVAQDAGVTCALYYLMFAFGGVGFAVPMGLLMAGVTIPAMFLRLLPQWVNVLGLVLTACGVLSTLNILLPQAVFLIPLTRFLGLVRLIAAGFLLPRTVAVRRTRPETTSAATAF
jgi:hypothetical protein